MRSGKTIKIQQEYEKAKADGKKALLIDKEQLEKYQNKDCHKGVRNDC